MKTILPILFLIAAALAVPLSAQTPFAHLLVTTDLDVSITLNGEKKYTATAGPGVLRIPVEKGDNILHIVPLDNGPDAYTETINVAQPGNKAYAIELAAKRKTSADATAARAAERQRQEQAEKQRAQDAARRRQDSLARADATRQEQARANRRYKSSRDRAANPTALFVQAGLHTHNWFADVGVQQFFNKYHSVYLAYRHSFPDKRGYQLDLVGSEIVSGKRAASGLQLGYNFASGPILVGAGIGYDWYKDRFEDDSFLYDFVGKYKMTTVKGILGLGGFTNDNDEVRKVPGGLMIEFGLANINAKENYWEIFHQDEKKTFFFFSLGFKIALRIP